MIYASEADSESTVINPVSLEDRNRFCLNDDEILKLASGQ